MTQLPESQLKQGTTEVVSQPLESSSKRSVDLPSKTTKEEGCKAEDDTASGIAVEAGNDRSGVATTGVIIKEIGGSAIEDNEGTAVDMNSTVNGAVNSGTGGTDITVRVEEGNNIGVEEGNTVRIGI